MPENMPISSGKVCLICGYEDCETVQQRFTESNKAGLSVASQSRW